MERDLGSLILATDISRQNDYLSRFRTHLDRDDLCLSSSSHRLFILQVGRLLRHDETSAWFGDTLIVCVLLFFFSSIAAPLRWLSSVQTSATPAGPGS